MESLPKNQVLYGNSIEILPTLPEKSVDLIFADPPYNLQLQNQLYRPNQTRVDAVRDDWDQFNDFEQYDDFTENWLRACRRVLKDSGTIWVIGSYHNIFRVGSRMLDIGYWILNDIIWYKTNPMPNFRGTRFTNATETLIWAKKSARQKKYTFNYHGMKRFNGNKQMPNVWRIPLCTGAERLKIDGKKAHSTQKPEALLYRVILASSNPGDLVLDPFFGTGTTGAVARKLQRDYIGIEANPRYVELARQRIAQIAGPVVEEELLVTRSKRDLPAVRFSQLIEGQYIPIGERLYSKSKGVQAVVRADSQLQVGDFVGSIHKAAARAQGTRSYNGWDFWYLEDQAEGLLSIDRLRDRYRKEHDLI